MKFGICSVPFCAHLLLVNINVMFQSLLHSTNSQHRITNYVYVSGYFVQHSDMVRAGCPKRWGLLSEEGGGFYL
jgi:hypothetical protein